MVREGGVINGKLREEEERERREKVRDARCGLERATPGLSMRITVCMDCAPETRRACDVCLRFVVVWRAESLRGRDERCCSLCGGVLSFSPKRTYTRTSLSHLSVLSHDTVLVTIVCTTPSLSRPQRHLCSTTPLASRETSHHRPKANPMPSKDEYKSSTLPPPLAVIASRCALPMPL